MQHEAPRGDCWGLGKQPLTGMAFSLFFQGKVGGISFISFQRNLFYSAVKKFVVPVCACNVSQQQEMSEWIQLGTALLAAHKYLRLLLTLEQVHRGERNNSGKLMISACIFKFIRQVEKRKNAGCFTLGWHTRLLMTQALFSLYADNSGVDKVERCISRGILSITDLTLRKWENVSHAGIRAGKKEW